MSTQNDSLKQAVRKLVVARVFDAPRELLWRAWTDPKQIMQWFKPACAFEIALAKVDLCVGGKYRIQMKNPDGEFFTAVGAYREIKAPERLVFTWGWEKDGSEADFGEVEPDETVVTVEFRALGKQTEVVLTHEKFSSQESRDKHEHGWSGCFDQLAKFINQ